MIFDKPNNNKKTVYWNDGPEPNKTSDKIRPVTKQNVFNQFYIEIFWEMFIIQTFTREEKIVIREEKSIHKHLETLP